MEEGGEGGEEERRGGAGAAELQPGGEKGMSRVVDDKLSCGPHKSEMGGRVNREVRACSDVGGAGARTNGEGGRRAS